jgi:HlyD family secretion protein
MKTLIRKPWFLAVLAVVVLIAAFLVIRAVRARAAAASSAALTTTKVVVGSLTSQVGATGTARARQSATLGFQTTGTVDQVNVKTGDLVRAGDVLATLTQTSLSPQLILAQADLVSAQRALDDLMKSSAAKAQAQLTLANAQKALVDVQFKWDVQQPGNRASSTTLKAAESKLVVAEDNMNRAKGVYDSAPSSDEERKAQAYLNYAAAVQQYQSALASLNWYRGKPTDNDQAILDAQLAQAEAAVADAQRAWDRVKDGPNPDDIAAAKARVASAQANVNIARIAAPFAGTITMVNIIPGDQVSPGTPAAGLADLTTYFVDVQVSEVDIDKVQAGQPVALTFDAIMDKSYTGKVTDIGMTGAIVQGVVTFEVTVQILDADPSVKPGMTAGVNILTTEINGVLVVPNRSVRTQDGERVVYVMRNGTPTPVKVKLGATSDTQSQVLPGDLKEGDEILVNPPTNSFMGGGPRGPFGEGGGGGGMFGGG